MAIQSARRRTLFGGLVSLAVLVLAELLLRPLGLPDPSVFARPEHTEGGMAATMMRGNPYRLWELSPGERQEQSGRVFVNALGLRDEERGPKNRTRAMSLGDSSVFGFGVDQREVFTSHIERRLGVDAVNGGVLGYSTEQALNLLAARMDAVQPDLLLVATLWSDNNFDQFVDREVLARYSAFEESPSARLRQGLRHSRVFGWTELALTSLVHGLRPARVGWMQAGVAGKSTRRRVPIGDYAENLARFCNIMADRGGGVAFIILANRSDLEDPDALQPWSPYRAVMRETATACGAPLVDFPAWLQHLHLAPRDMPFLDDMHPNNRGHQLLSDAVINALWAVGWPQRPLRTRRVEAAVTPPADAWEGVGIPAR